MFANLLRKFSLLIADALLVWGGYFVAYWLRIDVLTSTEESQMHWRTYHETLLWLIGIRLACGIVVRQYNWSFRQASLQEAISVTSGALMGSIIFIGLTFSGAISLNMPPKTVLVLEFASSLMFMGIIRFLPRYAVYFFHHHFFTAGEEMRVRTIIFGAGHSGQLLLRDMLHSEPYPHRVIGYIDDNPVKIGTRILGLPVLGRLEDLPELIDKRRVKKVLIAITKLPAARLRHLVDICAGKHVQFKKIPNYHELIQQGGKPLALQDLKLEDLLRREPVKFDNTVLAEFFIGKTVLVTGAAGSIGSELCCQLAGVGIKKLVALDINENDLYFLNLSMQESYPEVSFAIAFGSIRDSNRLEEVFALHQPNIVFHAAAHKHVPLMEDCPREALANNVLGTIAVAECAKRHHVERFVLISTDKAVRPANVMGATKYLAERAVERIAHGAEGRFMAVRFGNVLGSAGSLIPILQRQIHRGGPVTITHPQITRFFMTIPEAVGLVIIAAMQSEGTICVLDMGDPVRIDEIARHLITINGLIPEEDIPIKYVGLRPGEKMYEELFLNDEKLTRSSHPRIMVVHHAGGGLELERLKAEVGRIVSVGDNPLAMQFLHENVPGMAVTATPEALPPLPQ